MVLGQVQVLVGQHLGGPVLLMSVSIIHVIVVPASRADFHSRVKEQTKTSQSCKRKWKWGRRAVHQIVKRVVTRDVTKLFSEKICRKCRRVVMRRGHHDSGNTTKRQYITPETLLVVFFPLRYLSL